MSNFTFTDADCRRHALLLHDFNPSSATVAWFFLSLFIPGFICIVIHQFEELIQKRQRDRITREQQSEIESLFRYATSALGLQTIVFTGLCLLVQVQRYCGSGDYLSKPLYVLEWIVTILFPGNMLAVCLLTWVRALLAVRGKSLDLTWEQFWMWELRVITAPFALPGHLVLVLMKGPKACQDWLIVKFCHSAMRSIGAVFIQAWTFIATPRPPFWRLLHPAENFELGDETDQQEEHLLGLLSQETDSPDRLLYSVKENGSQPETESD